jgi:hypothetical protein
MAAQKQAKPSCDVQLLDSEKQLYGDRMMKGYKKIRLLGK